MPIVEPEDGKSYGMKKVSDWVDEDDLPLSKDDLRKYADIPVRLAYDREVEFGEVLENVEDEGPWEELVEMWFALGEGFRAVDPRVGERYQGD